MGGLEGATLEELHLGREAEGWLRSDVESQRTVEIQWRDGDSLPCELTACQVNHRPLGFLIGIRVCGHPHALSTR